MTKSNYTDLIEALTTLKANSYDTSEGDNRMTNSKAIDLVNSSTLPDDDRKTLIKAISSNANPSGWYYNDNGINAAVSVLNEMIETNAISASVAETVSTPLAFNLKNLKSLVSDGRIFSVDFIKRSTGELRTMTARVGITKHLKGGTKAYSAAKNNLLTVFDMEKANGYRSIQCRRYSGFQLVGKLLTLLGRNSMKDFGDHQDDLTRFLAQSKSVLACLVCDEAYSRLSDECLSNIIWLIGNRLDEMTKTTDSLLKAIQSKA